MKTYSYAFALCVFMIVLANTLYLSVLMLFGTSNAIYFDTAAASLSEDLSKIVSSVILLKAWRSRNPSGFLIVAVAGYFIGIFEASFLLYDFIYDHRVDVRIFLITVAPRPAMQLMMTFGIVCSFVDRRWLICALFMAIHFSYNYAPELLNLWHANISNLVLSFARQSAMFALVAWLFLWLNAAQCKGR